MLCPFKMYRQGALVSTKEGFGNNLVGYAVFLLDYQAKSWMVGRYDGRTDDTHKHRQNALVLTRAQAGRRAFRCAAHAHSQNIRK